MNPKRVKSTGSIRNIAMNLFGYWKSLLEEASPELSQRWGPVGRIIAGSIEDRQGADLFDQLVRRASAQFASFRERRPDKKSLRTIFLTGDIYLRLDDFGSDSIIRRLNARGMRVIVEPLWVLAEYLAEERSAELFNLPQGSFMKADWRSSLMREVPETFLRNCPGTKSRGCPSPDVPEMLEKAKPIIKRHPRGEAPITVGSVHPSLG